MQSLYKTQLYASPIKGTSHHGLQIRDGGVQSPGLGKWKRHTMTLLVLPDVGHSDVGKKNKATFPIAFDCTHAPHVPELRRLLSREFVQYTGLWDRP